MLLILNATINVHLAASGFHTEKQTKKRGQKGTQKIYIHIFIYKLKNLVQMSCYIYKMLMLRGGKKLYTVSRKRKTYFKRGQGTGRTSNL